MTSRVRAALALAVLFLVPVSILSIPTVHADVRGRQALVITLDGVSFERLMAVPELRQLGRAGGAAIMTTRVESNSLPSAYATMWAGAISAPRLGPSPLYSALRSAGISVCQNTTNEELPEAIGRVRQLSGPLRSPSCLKGWRLDLRGGLGAIQVGLREITCIEVCTRVPREVVTARLRSLGKALRRNVEMLPDQRTLILITAPAPSSEMARRGDKVTPLVMAVGLPDQLLRARGRLRGLTSDTTRQDGLVSNVDVAPTILEFFGVPAPSSMVGTRMRPTHPPAPFALHTRHLEQRRIRLPVQFAELAFVVVGGLLAIATLVWFSVAGAVPPRTAGAMRFITLAASAMLIALVAGAGLPHLSYPWIFTFVPLTMIVLALLAASVGRRRGTFGPFAFLGFVGLGLLVLDAVLGGRSLRVPLFGGTMFDGVRYYGLPNGFIPMLLASALFVAWALEPFAGFLVLFAAGLFAGFPSLGANVGAAITLSFAAGLWWVLRTRRRVDIRGGAFVAAVTTLGLGATLLANRWLPGTPTHATRFVESGTGHGLGVIADRLAVGVDMIARVPAALIPLVGLGVVLWLSVRRAGPIGAAMAIDEGWRHAVMVLAVASFVAYLANDTGPAAADPAFVYAMAGIVYPAMVVSSRRAPPAPDRSLVPGALP